MLLALHSASALQPLQLRATLRHALDSSHVGHALDVMRQMADVALAAETGADGGGALLKGMLEREADVRSMCEDFEFGLSTHSDPAVAGAAVELGRRYAALLVEAQKRAAAAEQAAAVMAAAEMAALIESGEGVPLHWTERWFLDMDYDEDTYVTALELEAFALARYGDNYHALREAKAALVPHELRAADVDGDRRVTAAELRGYCGGSALVAGGAVSAVCAGGSGGSENFVDVDVVVLPGAAAAGAAVGAAAAEAAAAVSATGVVSGPAAGAGAKGELTVLELLASITVARLVMDDVATLFRFVDTDMDGDITLIELKKSEKPLAAFKSAMDHFVLPPGALELVEAERAERGGGAGDADDSADSVVAAAEDAKAAARAARKAAEELVAKDEATARAAVAKAMAEAAEAAEAAAATAAAGPPPEERGAAGEAHSTCTGCGLGTSGACFVEQEDGSRLCFDVEEDGKCSLGAERCE